jgi:hypothetical protein
MFQLPGSRSKPGEFSYGPSFPQKQKKKDTMQEDASNDDCEISAKTADGDSHCRHRCVYGDAGRGFIGFTKFNTV